MDDDDILELFSEYYNENISTEVKRYYNPVRMVLELLRNNFVDVDWLKKYLLETKLLNYSFNQMLWILSGITINKTKNNKLYINYSLRSRIAFRVSFKDIKIIDRPIMITKEITEMYFNYVRGDNEFILPKTIFDLDYFNITLVTPGKDDQYQPRYKEDGIPAPIIQLPNLKAKSIRIDLYFLEELPIIWENQLENLTIKIGNSLIISDRFDELERLERLELKFIHEFPMSIYKCRVLKHLKIKGKIKVDMYKILNMESLHYFELSSPLPLEERENIKKTLARQQIKTRITGYTELDLD